jgi:glycosyltransferase involved in cell wall biosynthesis
MRCLDGAVALSYTVQKDIESFRKDIPLCHTFHPIFDNYGRKTSRNEALKALNLDTKPSYMLFFGFVRDYKGLDLLIEAFADSRLRNKNLKLLVAGEFYNNEAQYRQLISKYNLEEEVIIYNRFISDNEVGLFFSGADLVVQPYKTATQSGVTQIAFQFDKPMLVTDTGGLKEIVKHQKCGYVVKPEPGEIADAINDFFVNERKSGFSDYVKKEKSKFSWSKMTDTINEVFYKCLLQQLIKAL